MEWGEWREAGSEITREGIRDFPLAIESDKVKEQLQRTPNNLIVGKSPSATRADSLGGATTGSRPPLSGRCGRGSSAGGSVFSKVESRSGKSCK